MYTVIGSTKTRAFRVVWLLEELGLTYTHLPLRAASDEVRPYNPTGKVPVLLDGDTTVTDSTAIMTYLADKHGALTNPAGTLDRARQDSLTHFLLDEFDAVLWTSARHSFILPEELRMPAIKDSLRWEFARSQTVLTHRMADGPFLMGDTMTLPDILLTHCLVWGMIAKFPVTEPRLTDYLARMRDRPAYLAAAAK